MPNHEGGETHEKIWDEHTVSLIGKSQEEVREALIEGFGIEPETLTSIQDLVDDTAQRIAGGDYTAEEKVRRRLGLEYGPLSYEEREALRAETSRQLPVMFEDCELAGCPLVAIVGYGSVFDLRMGFSLTESDLDLRVIPLNGQEDGNHASWLLGKKYNRAVLDAKSPHRVDVHSDWLTGAWLDANLSKPGKLEVLQNQFRYVKPGSVIVARNNEWANLLKRALDLESKGVVVEALDYK